MKKLSVPIIVVLLLMSSCKDSQVNRRNRFSDPEFQKIYTLQDNRNSEGLKNYFNNKSEEYRIAAVEAAGSVQDKNLIADLGIILTEDVSAKIRKAAAYAIGQCGNVEGENLLIKALDKELDPSVRAEAMEAIGKCGSDAGLKFLSENTSSTDEEGIVKGIYRFCLRKLFSPAGTKRVIDALKSKNLSVREYCSFYFARTNDRELDKYGKEVIGVFENETSPVVKMNLALMAGKLKKDNGLLFAKVAINDVDYRVRCNLLNSVRRLKGAEFTEYIVKGVEDRDINVQVAASGLLAGREGVNGDTYKNLLKKQNLFWRVKVNLLKALLEVDTQIDETVKEIKGMVAESTDNYEKASLVKLLERDTKSYNYLGQMVLGKELNVVRMSALEALLSMRKRDLSFFNRDRALEFLGFLKTVIADNDPALVTISCSAISDKGLNHKELIEETDFLKEALKKASSPNHLEARDAIEKTLKYLDPSYETSKKDSKKENGIDWNYVSGIPENQIVVVKTNRGDIFIQLLVNSSPGSVANFLKLVDQSYYKNNFFHRVVPNFVIQCGCNRGDGWGGPDYTIRSELSNIGYRTGYVGMASAGKDTEGSQWFITHSPTPHLDGRYTIFGKVVKGLELVHKIRRGDKITQITRTRLEK